jgi:hypothetical protein
MSECQQIRLSTTGWLLDLDEDNFVTRPNKTMFQFANPLS